MPADTIPPVTSASRDPAWTTGKWGWDVAPPTWTLTATDEDGSGVARIEYRFGDGGDWLAYGGPITLGEGVWHLWYHAIDNAGNVESPQMVATLVDLTAPTASIADSFQGFAGEPVTLSVQASDGTSGIGIVTWSTGGSGDGLTQIAHTWDEPGAYAVSVQVQDRAGNTTGVSTTVYIESREDTGEGSEQADIEP
ncbi:MAG: PKD domain-containing protein [Anaerolineae bacterium]|nr:PKD domain-containing protein [Anaerolineae bacterium]